jgi:hypothetical protein
MTLIDLTIGLAIVSFVLFAVAVVIQREARSLTTVTNRNDRERRARVMLGRLESEIEYAQAANPTAWLTADLGAGGATARVDSVDGFPDVGMLLIDAGEVDEERIDYQLVNSAPPGFTNLTRGQMCTSAALHDEGEQVLWSAIARHIDDQTAPPAAQFDGISQELSGQVFFRGEGTGFSYRVPLDIDGDGDLYDGDEVSWGAVVRGDETADGWTAVYFEPVAVVTEAGRQSDLNGDGDRVDAFDLGRVRVRSWDASAPGQATDHALCSTMILQEQCNWGGDLDGDGFDDPMFLWDPVTGRLRIRLFLLTGADSDRPVLRTVEAASFLRNGVRE